MIGGRGVCQVRNTNETGIQKQLSISSLTTDHCITHTTTQLAKQKPTWSNKQYIVLSHHALPLVEMLHVTLYRVASGNQAVTRVKMRRQR